MNEESIENIMKRRAYYYVICAAVCWGIIGIFVKKLNSFGFGTIQIVFIRAFCAALSLIIYILIKDRKIVKISLCDFKYFVGTGWVSLVFFNCCYFIAIDKTSLSVAAILLYTSPTIVVILSVILFKEKMTSKKIASLIMTFIGCILVTLSLQGTGNKITFIGILAGLGAGLGYALYSIFGMYALRKYDSITVTLYTFIFAEIGLIPFINIKEIINLFSNSNAIYYSIVLGIISTALPFLLYTKGLTYLETSKASIITSLEPIVATIIGIVLFNEPITFLKIAGISVVVYALFIIREIK